MNNAKIYLKESVLDDDRSQYVGGNMLEFEANEIELDDSGVWFLFKGNRYYVPNTNIRMIRFIK